MSGWDNWISSLPSSFLYCDLHVQHRPSISIVIFFLPSVLYSCFNVKRCLCFFVGDNFTRPVFLSPAVTRVAASSRRWLTCRTLHTLKYRDKEEGIPFSPCVGALNGKPTCNVYCQFTGLCSTASPYILFQSILLIIIIYCHQVRNSLLATALR